MRVLFFGSPAFAVPSLGALQQSSHTVVGVVTQPDRPRGRGQRVTPGAVAAVAAAAGLPLLQPQKLSAPGVADALTDLGADLGVVAAYGKILPDWLLALPAGGMINVHASLLPAYRGAAPIHRAILNGDAETGVTIMRVVTALDAGPMLDRVVVPIDDATTSEALERALASAGATLLVDVIDRLARGVVVETPQDHARATYASKITRADSPVSWTATARAVHDHIRGLHPWPHASSTIEGRRLILHRSQGLDATSHAPAGTVVAVTGEGVDVVAGDGRLVRLLDLQAEGGRRLPAGQFLAGHPLSLGSRFGGP